MKNLLYSFTLFVSFGTVLSTPLMANPIPYEGYFAYGMQQPNETPTTPMWNKTDYNPMDPIEGGIRTKASKFGKRTDNFSPQQRDVGPLGQKEQPPQTEPFAHTPRKRRIPAAQQERHGPTAQKERRIPTQEDHELNTLLAKLAIPITQKERRIPAAQKERRGPTALQERRGPAAQKERRSPTQEDHEQNTLLAKLALVGELGDRIELRPLTRNIKQILRSKTVIQLDVNINGRHKPYFFKKLRFTCPEGENNQCKASFFFDTITVNALKSPHLGQGPGWENQDIYLNWRQNWQRGLAVIIIMYGNQAYELVPFTQGSNQAIAQIDPKDWKASPAQKFITGATAAAGTAAALAAIYYGYHYGQPILTAGIDQARKYGPDIKEKVQQKVQQFVPPAKQKIEKIIRDNILPQKTTNETQPLQPQPEQQQNPFDPKTYSDPYNNAEILRAIGDAYWAIQQASGKYSTWCIVNKAHKISWEIAKLIANTTKFNIKEHLQCVQRFCETTRSILIATESPYNEDPRFDRESTAAYQQARQNSSTGTICDSTWQMYEELIQYFESLSQHSSMVQPFVIQSTITKTEKAIQDLYNTPDGKQGMTKAISFIESITGKAGTLTNPMLYQPIDISELNIPFNQDTDTPLEQGIKATACYIIIQSTKSLLAHIKNEKTTFSVIQGMEQKIQQSIR
jgi:hypothetical protein